MEEMQKAAEPARSGSVAAEINSLASAITNMEDLVELLHNRLKPVLVEGLVGENTRADVPEPPRSMLANGLNEFSNRQERLNRRIDQIINDLSL